MSEARISVKVDWSQIHPSDKIHLVPSVFDRLKLCLDQVFAESMWINIHTNMEEGELVYEEMHAAGDLSPQQVMELAREEYP